MSRNKEKHSRQRKRSRKRQWHLVFLTRNFILLMKYNFHIISGLLMTELMVVTAVDAMNVVVVPAVVTVMATEVVAAVVAIIMVYAKAV